MKFTDFTIGQIVDSAQITNHFQIKNISSVSFSKHTGSLVLVSDVTKTIYPDKMIGSVFHFTGQGRTGDQAIHKGVNAKLAASGENGTDIHLFVAMGKGAYIYCGNATLCSTPYTEIQPDKDGNDRQVWMFPIKPEAPECIPKSNLLTFADKEDYQTNGASALQEFFRKKSGYKGCRVKHIQHGLGTVQKLEGEVMTVQFDNREIKTYIYKKSFAGGYLEWAA